MSEEKDNVIELEGSLGDVRKQLEKINLDEKFIIFALDYGIGKTFLIEEKIISGDLPKGNFFSRRHDRLNETAQKFDEKGFSDYQHLYGFSYEEDGKQLGCPDFTTNKDIKKYYGKPYKLPASLICQFVCKSRRNCPYKKQFKNDKAWQLAPHEFLNIIKPKEYNVIDEEFSAFDEFDYPDKANLKVFKKYTNRTYESELKVPEYAIKYAIKEAGRKGEENDLKEIIKISNRKRGSNLIREHNIKPFDGKLYVPRIFNVFNYLKIKKDSNVILLDGGFNFELFKHLKKLYSLDIPNPIVYKSNLQNKNTKVIRVNQNKSYFRGSRDGRSWDWDLAYFFDPISLIVSLQRQGKKVGIITAKEIEEKFEMEGVITSHYGDTSGTNKFVGCTALILFVEHHWSNLDLAKYYRKLFGKYPREEKNRKVKKKGMKMVHHVMDSTSIEAGFRIRPLEHNVEIYFFRHIHDMFKQKFSADEKKLEEFIEEPITEVNFSEIAKILAKAQYAKNRTELANLTGYTAKRYNMIKILSNYRIIKL